MTHMSNEFTVTLSNAAKDEAAERGYALNIYDANQDAQNQADQIEQAITLGVEGIIIERYLLTVSYHLLKLQKRQALMSLS